MCFSGRVSGFPFIWSRSFVIKLLIIHFLGRTKFPHVAGLILFAVGTQFKTLLSVGRPVCSIPPRLLLHYPEPHLYPNE